MFRRLRARRRTVASVAIAASAATALGVMAFVYEGFSTTDVDLHDGGVWVTKTDTSQLGHLNVAAGELDGGPTARTSNFDVVQDDSAVVFLDFENAAMQLVDEAGMSLGPAVGLPPGAVVVANGGVTAILTSEGGLFVLPTVQVGGFVADADPLASLGEGAAVTVTEDGDVIGVSLDNATVSTWSVANGTVEAPVIEARPELARATAVTVTAVGQTAVILDADGGELLLPSGTVAVPEGAVLQHPGPAADAAAIATGTQLIMQPLDGGEAEVTTYADEGDAVAPMQLNGCVFGVWPGADLFVRECLVPRQSTTHTIDDHDDSPLVFRERRGQVVLNLVEEGSVWIVTDSIVLVDNWEALLPENTDEVTETDEESLDDELTNQPPPPTTENSPPIANDDEFGARAGRSTILPVLWNDSDPDGDVLVVTPENVPEGIEVSAVHNGSRLQVDIPANYDGGTFTVGYRVDDGRSGEAAAVVTVSISAPDENAPPEQLRDSRFEVEQTAQLEYQALQDWFDPDGDDMFLLSATPDSEDAVQSSPDGSLLFTATGDPGAVDVALRVSDGNADGIGEGTVAVTVSERGASTPIANTDSISTVPGVPVTVFPLRNDYVGGRDAGRLALVTADPQVVFAWDGEAATVTVEDAPLGTHYLDYQLAVGPNVANGRIRLDVTSPDNSAAPVAVRDVGLLTQNSEVLIDVLANDLDPAGGVLVVQSFDVSATAPISVELLERSILRVTDNGLTEPAELRYLVSNGTSVATGTVVVVPVAPTTQPRPPVGVQDTWVVREGDYTSIPITDNDFSPDSIPFAVSPELLESSLDGDTSGATAFIDGEVLRVHTPVGGPRNLEFVYQLEDEQGRTSAATVTVDVNVRDEDANAAPVPQALEARVIAGSDVRIPVPLDGVDPDGDRVSIVGYSDAPEQGQIVETGAGFFVFHAEAAASGTVQFQYTVRDRWGATGSALIQVGIAQPSTTNDPPTPTLDTVLVQPGRALAVDALGNDTDPNGDQLSLGALPEGDIADVAVDEERQVLVMTAPEEPGEYVVPYTVEDDRGLSANGTVILTVTPDAPEIRPVAVDDILLSADVVADTPFDVPVLDNDLDQDGNAELLDVSVVSGPGTVTASTVQVIPAVGDFQVVTYEVTDPDGLTASAFVEVPPATLRPPWLSVSSLDVPSGTPTEIDIADVVAVSTNNTPRITDRQTVSASFAASADWYVDDTTLVYQSELGYRGEASITFEVTDGESVDDPDGQTSMLTLPLNVVDSSAVVPEFASPSINVGQGEEAVLFSLPDATTDPDPGDIASMTYEIAAALALTGVTATIDSNRNLVTQASFDAIPGDSGQLTLRIRDAAGNTIEAAVIVTVTASSMPLAEARDDRAEGLGGQPITVPVLANDFNPFAQQGGELSVVGVEVIAGDAEASFSQDTVTVTPAQEFAGTLQLRYRIQDRTETTQRERTGAIVVTVRNRPEPPARPNIQSVGNEEVTLSWVPGGDNGSPIVNYIVAWDGGSQECASTTCTITGLANNVEVTFTVAAVNEIGTSDPSPASSVARPDTKPDQPPTPTATRGDTQLTVEWEPATSEGSPVTSYTVEISPPAPGNVTQLTSTTTSLTWPALTNGVAYTFRVQAHNLAPEPSDWSEYSTPVVPAGVPVAPLVNAVGGSPSGEPGVIARWETPDGNGAPVTGYVVTPYIDGAAQPEQNTTALELSYSSPNLQAGSTVSFTVVAVNEVGPSAPSARSAEVRAVANPGTPQITGSSDHDQYALLTISVADTNGWRADELSYHASVDGGPYQPMTQDGAGWRAAATNAAHTVTVIAVAPPLNGVTYQSGASNAQAIAPFGVPFAPQAGEVVRQNEVTVTWAPPAPNGREIAYLEYRMHVDDPFTRVEPTPGSITIERDPFEDTFGIGIYVVAYDTEGQASAGTEGGGFPIGLRIERGEANSGAYPLVADVRNFPAVTYEYSCIGSSGVIVSGTWTANITSGKTSSTASPFCQPSAGSGLVTLRLRNTTNGDVYSATANW